MTDRLQEMPRITVIPETAAHHPFQPFRCRKINGMHDVRNFRQYRFAVATSPFQKSTIEKFIRDN
jgi:hypothetical protein